MVISRFVLSMEKKGGEHFFLKLVLFLFCFSSSSNNNNPPYVQCLERTTLYHLSTDPPSPSKVPASKNKFQRIILSILFGVIAGLVLSLVFACIVRCFIRYIKRTPILKGPVIFSPRIAPKTLQAALANETHLLGSSPNGKYYRTVLDNGLTIAVKRLEPFEAGSVSSPERKTLKRKIQRDLEILAGLRHRNLMSLRAYVREPDNRFCLVYDFIGTGSLEDAMKRVRENQLQLSWDLRLRIAVGVIKALQYLHFTCTPRILHYNLKPSNVMLDAEFEPRLGDCGLAKLMPRFHTRSPGYSAPECFSNLSMYTDKSDVFSFGVILGVLLTGRDPTDPFFREANANTNSNTRNGGDMGKWLRHLQEAGEAREALDKSILVGEEMEEDEMLMAVRIAAVCLSDLPADRPSSDELVPMLTQLHSF